MTNGSFSSLTIVLTLSLDGGNTFQNVNSATWDVVTTPQMDFPVSEQGLYQFSIAEFSGGTSVTVHGNMVGGPSFF